MPEIARKGSNGKDSAKTEGQISPPSINLPTGGGAIRGMGEKFAVNPVTGTGSTTVPIATSPGRSGFGPQLSLSYDPGAGNGPFGFDWSLSRFLRDFGGAVLEFEEQGDGPIYASRQEETEQAMILVIVVPNVGGSGNPFVLQKARPRRRRNPLFLLQQNNLDLHNSLISLRY